MDSQPGQVIPANLDFASVDPSAHLDVEDSKSLSDRYCAFDGSTGAVEGGEESVARGVHFSTSEALDLRSNALVVPVEQVAPSSVAEAGGPGSGSHDVG